MTQRLHVQLDDHVFEKLADFATAANKTTQDCVAEAIDLLLGGKAAGQKGGRERFRFIDLFAGIGGMRLAFEACGGRCVFSSEWDKYCQKTYFENFGETPFGDITKIDGREVPDHDVLVAGFPCQPFSLAGVSKKNSLGRPTGFLDKTQGTLFFDVARIIDAKRPRAFLLENVKNLRGHDKGKTWKVITEALDELDYQVFSSVLDGRAFRPQHRERIFIAGFDRRRYGAAISFDFPAHAPKNPPKVRDILEDRVAEKYTLTDHLWGYLQAYAEKHRAKGNGFGYGLADLDGATRTLSARYHKDGSEILIPQPGRNPRRLTPRECARLQGYPDTFKIPVSDAQAYRQFGNSVVVPLVAAVAEKIASWLESPLEYRLLKAINGASCKTRQGGVEFPVFSFQFSE